MDSILTKLAKERSAAQIQSMSKQSFNWLKSKILELKNPGKIPAMISRENSRQLNRIALGGLYFFFYDPKGKKDLPYYDAFPLVLILEKYGDGFLGLNLHYLPLNYRLLFMDKLMKYATLKDNHDIQRIRVTYDILNASRRFPEFRVCVKRYLYSNIRSKILTVQPNEWDIAVYLPIQQFKKARETAVWKESLEEIKDAGQH